MSKPINLKIIKKVYSMRTLKGIITKATYSYKTGIKHVTVVKPEDYVEPVKTKHNKNVSYDPFTRQSWQRGGYLKRIYGK